MKWRCVGLKFKILPKVDGFTDATGVHHAPGEIVDLPASYKGESWLKPVEPEPKVEVPAAKVEAPEAPVAVPLEEKKSKKKAK